MNVFEILIYLLTASLIGYGLLFYRFHIRINRLEKVLKTILGREEERFKKLRKRYIVFAVISEKSFSRKEVEEGIRKTMKRFFGENILVKADPQLIYFDPAVKRGVVRVVHLYKDHLIATLGLMREMNGEKCLLIPIKTTGTIKRARKMLYKLRRELQK